MSTTTTVPNDVATRHVSVVVEPYLGQLQAGGRSRVLRGNVLQIEPAIGQTNIHAGQGFRHSNATLIEHATAIPGDILPEAELVAGIAAAAAKQALVPEQQKAREARDQAMRAADPPLTAEQRAWVRAQHAAKPGGAP
jgi:hypothetical protein